MLRLFTALLLMLFTVASCEGSEGIPRRYLIEDTDPEDEDEETDTDSDSESSTDSETDSATD